MVDRPDVVRDNPNVPHNHSTFPLKEIRLTTEHFGLVKPHMVIDDITTDDIDYRPEYRTRSYTLRAPLMQDVHRKLSYVKVDLSAILPFNYEKFYTNPVVGQDVPDNVGTVVSGGYYKLANCVKNVLDAAFTAINGANNFTNVHLTSLMKAIVFGELFYSRGCLLSSLGSHISSHISANLGVGHTNESYDFFFDWTCSKLLNYLNLGSSDYLVVRIGSGVKNVIINSTYKDDSNLKFREFLNEIRETSDWEVLFLSSSSITSIATDFAYTPSFTLHVANDIPFNFGRACAYQLAVAEYMTNDKVDHIYSAELFRQYIGSLILDYFATLGYPNTFATFTVNGIKYQYDHMSGLYLDDILSNVALNVSNFTVSVNQYFISLFGYRRSLRYKDYFVSSRVRPLAVGNVDVQVNSNLVSVIDISRNIQVQRFLNAVNHSGRKLSNYIKTFFGINISPDRHVPHWLADIDEMVYTSEVENTGAAQWNATNETGKNSVTATFTGNSGNKQLHFYADLPGYIIGLTSYDIERAYTDTINRSFFIQDRFDMFIPEMQFIGDQPVYIHELIASDPQAFGTAFGYQYRDMQYKLFHAVADGGFVENLPGYGFMFNKHYLRQNISPDFIRSKVSELDDFYLSLTGYSLASYFHFISVIINNFTAKRPMIANPKILE